MIRPRSRRWSRRTGPTTSRTTTSWCDRTRAWSRPCGRCGAPGGPSDWSRARCGAVRCGAFRFAELADAFDVIVGSDDVTHLKPHPEPVLAALARLGAAPETAVFIGDSRHDIECGRAAGVKTAAVLWGPFDRSHLADLAPDYWLERPGDLSLLTTDN